MKISAKTGLTVRDAAVATAGTTITPASVPAYILQSKATVNEGEQWATGFFPMARCAEVAEG